MALSVTKKTSKIRSVLLNMQSGIKNSVPKDRKMWAYPFRIFTRPFDSFSDMKYEAKGSVLIANFILFLYFLSSVAEYMYTGFLYNDNDTTKLNIFVQLFSSVAIVVLWAVANWAVCTLMDGEGTFKEIWIASCYSLTPMILGELIYIPLSNILVYEEQVYLQLIHIVSILLLCFFLFAGMLVTHQYTALKTVLSCLLTVAAVILIMFLFLLVFSVVQQMYGFIQTVSTEILNRT